MFCVLQMPYLVNIKGAIRMHDQQIVMEGTKGKRPSWWDQDYARVRNRRPINNRFSP